MSQEKTPADKKLSALVEPVSIIVVICNHPPYPDIPRALSDRNYWKQEFDFENKKTYLIWCFNLGDVLSYLSAHHKKMGAPKPNRTGIA